MHSHKEKAKRNLRNKFPLLLIEIRYTMLKRIKILNFRGIKEGVIDDLKQVTLIIGKNGSGKSSILEALYAVSAYAEDYDEIRGIRKLDYIINRRGNRGLWDDARQSIWYLQDVENPIIISLSLNSEEYEFTILNTKIINNPVQLRSPSGRVEALFEEYLGRILFIDGRLLLQPEKIEKYAWSRVVAKRLDKLIVSMIREEFEEEAEGLTYIPIGNTYYLALQTSETTIRIDDLGDGARTALLTALLTIAYKPTLILIEEPELHMHPRRTLHIHEIPIKTSKRTKLSNNSHNTQHRTNTHHPRHNKRGKTRTRHNIHRERKRRTKNQKLLTRRHRNTQKARNRPPIPIQVLS
ncbi:MAG: hypothetical protein DRZ82_09195 [Thermoprotei archaeon]|nr:MAG: hypothetical protein DRZ82_09195 [Thermoprotei archaeon]